MPWSIADASKSRVTHLVPEHGSEDACFARLAFQGAVNYLLFRLGTFGGGTPACRAESHTHGSDAYSG